MQLFEYILILLVAILISNFINRYVSSLSVPIIQIVLGVCIAFFYSDFQLELNPELFLMMFIAPILFNDSVRADKKSLWAKKKPIFLLAFGLVFIAVIAIGYFANWLIPAIPLAAAFALAAALAPTDAVAVSSIAKKIKMPQKIMSILEGESLINDASGIVCFQFAVAAMLTGKFSLAQAGLSFVIIAVGGALIGAVMAFLKHFFVKWLRSQGIENATLHILIQILLPFLVFLIAEHFAVSGILAVVTAGLLQTIGVKKVSPEKASLNIASTSIWSLLTFTLNGMVFLILGTQLPDIMKVVWSNASISHLRVVLYIIILTFAVILLRFLWSLLIINRRVYQGSMSRFKASLVISLAGVRGAVTLATAMSIPFTLDDGTPFPERAMIIFISSGVILCSLLLANFILPLLFERESETDSETNEKEVSIEILNQVILELKSQETPETKTATEIVTRDYYMRILNLQRERVSQGDWYCVNDEERDLKIQALEWEKEHISKLIESKEIPVLSGEHYLEYLENIIQRYRNPKKRMKFLRVLLRSWMGRHYYILKNRKKDKALHVEREQLLDIRLSSHEYILKRLREMEDGENQTLVELFISEYQLAIEIFKLYRKSSNWDSPSGNSLDDVLTLAFQAERDQIHFMFEEGRISRETARGMRDDISLLEIELKDDLM